MLFRRREAESFLARLRVHLWPRRSWSRSTRYVVHRVRRLSATPHAVALGFAAGVFVSATPFLGTHLIVAALIAWVIGGSMVAAVLGTFVGNPLTYPLFWVSTYEVGHLMLGGGDKQKAPIDLWGGDFQSSLDQLWPLVKPMTLGAFPVGIGLAALSYVLVKPTVNAYQHRRRALTASREAMEAR
ncbi:hypothetical protein AUC69_03580 [Methyloceanibacter superfactus]|uniref:DUF2062 domain-containing protein n=1 Tax=Methyloceanibacter superfactus TaxID=1774969 RepID=A0A1E3VL44_9HYPH|nr:DUF2062 domain-containing protein [Methyloceanibacter superfactus]ODR94237.1 hypothetical protein AUC69_03580 [Methyloceanibacter superfactus]